MLPYVVFENSASVWRQMPITPHTRVFAVTYPSSNLKPACRRVHRGDARQSKLEASCFHIQKFRISSEVTAETDYFAQFADSFAMPPRYQSFHHERLRREIAVAKRICQLRLPRFNSLRTHGSKTTSDCEPKYSQICQWSTLRNCWQRAVIAASVSSVNACCQSIFLTKRLRCSHIAIPRRTIFSRARNADDAPVACATSFSRTTIKEVAKRTVSTMMRLHSRLRFQYRLRYASKSGDVRTPGDDCLAAGR